MLTFEASPHQGAPNIVQKLLVSGKPHKLHKNTGIEITHRIFHSRKSSTRLALSTHSQVTTLIYHAEYIG
jgi:hypothetical protein